VQGVLRAAREKSGERPERKSAPFEDTCSPPGARAASRAPLLSSRPSLPRPTPLAHKPPKHDHTQTYPLDTPGSRPASGREPDEQEEPPLLSAIGPPPSSRPPSRPPHSCFPASPCARASGGNRPVGACGPDRGQARARLGLESARGRERESARDRGSFCSPALPLPSHATPAGGGGGDPRKTTKKNGHDRQ
jgi:hypothetical protein